MPNLGDYIGHLLSEMTIARMHADLEAVRVAELYASHPLLRHMPVPHFRLPDVEMDIPVAVKKVGEEPPGSLPRGTPKLDVMRASFDKLVKVNLDEKGVQLKPAQQRKLKAALDKAQVKLDQPSEIAVDVLRVADELAHTVSGVIGAEKMMDRAALVRFEDSLKEAARKEMLGLRKPPSRLEVLVTTGEIREAGPDEVITHVHLKVIEEGYEWTSIESDGRRKDRLIIE